MPIVNDIVSISTGGDEDNQSLFICDKNFSVRPVEPNNGHPVNEFLEDVTWSTKVRTY